MSSPAPVDVGDALDDLINQFADPMSFFRELIQNALDAGSGEVDVDFEFEAGETDPEQGAMIVVVTDYGEGMDREIIDNKLTRLFSSAKDGDMTKIGKFGIGFVSVFAIDPDAVCVDTARAGEGWRVLFDKRRNFKRLRLSQAMEGTRIRIIKNSSRADYAAFKARARQVIHYWCRHANGEVRVEGQLISEPFGLEAPLVHVYQDDFSHVHIGHLSGGQTRHAYFNGGLTLVDANETHGSAISHLWGLGFKVSSRYLEHTLTRDDVIKDGHFHKVVAKLTELARGPLRDRVFAELDAAVRAGWPQQWGPEAERLQLLHGAALWHARDRDKGLSRAERKLACARAPSGRIYSWGELFAGIERAGELWVAAARSPLSDAAEAEEFTVIASYAGVGPTNSADEEDLSLLRSPMQALLQMGLSAGGDEPRWLGLRCFMPVAPDADETRQWRPLATHVERILDLCAYKIDGCRFGHFAGSGSLLRGRVAISQREFGEITRQADAGALGTGLFTRRRILVIDADHPVVRTLLGLSLREVELAAYQLIKLFFVRGAAIEPELDSNLASAAMQMREQRCPRPQS